MTDESTNFQSDDSLNKCKEKAENLSKYVNFLSQEAVYEPINLGNFTYQYLEDGEVCLFHQPDVGWYEYTSVYREPVYVGNTARFGGVSYTAFTPFGGGQSETSWRIRAAGDLYLTNRKVILYDPGFSNIWTMLGTDGDYPEQVLCFPLEEIRHMQKDFAIQNVNKEAVVIHTIYGAVMLMPSERKYRGRKTPRHVRKYDSLNLMIDKIEKLFNYQSLLNKGGNDGQEQRNFDITKQKNHVSSDQGKVKASGNGAVIVYKNNENEIKSMLKQATTAGIEDVQINNLSLGMSIKTIVSEFGFGIIVAENEKSEKIVDYPSYTHRGNKKVVLQFDNENLSSVSLEPIEWLPDGSDFTLYVDDRKVTYY